MNSVKAAKTTGKANPYKKDPAKSAKNTVSPEERQRMIAEAAYFRAEQRGFQGGNPEQDWLESEVEIDKRFTV